MWIPVTGYIRVYNIYKPDFQNVFNCIEVYFCYLNRDLVWSGSFSKVDF